MHADQMGTAMLLLMRQDLLALTRALSRKLSMVR